jgi:fatty-acyl-CoA synthase
MSTIVSGAYWFGVTPDTTVLGTLPLFHVTGMQGAHEPAHLHRRHRGADDAGTGTPPPSLFSVIASLGLDQHRHHGIDFLANPNLARHDLSSLQRIGGGGAPPCPRQWRDGSST